MENITHNGITFHPFWMVAITSEMALNLNTGLKNRQGDPFTQFRKVFPEAPRKDKMETLRWANQLLINNNMKPTAYFTKTLNKLNPIAG